MELDIRIRWSWGEKVEVEMDISYMDKMELNIRRRLSWI
jgi:hypothetical protein